MRKVEKTVTVFLASDGTEFGTDVEAFIHDADTQHADFRDDFCRERTKTERSYRALRNTLRAYDIHVASAISEKADPELFINANWGKIIPAETFVPLGAPHETTDRDEDAA